MHALSLLLCAAGANAMLGIKISAVQLPDNKIFCSDNCAFDGANFEDSGSVCAAKELVVQLDDQGNERPEPYKYTCAENASKLKGWSTRPRKDGEEPENCDTKEIDKALPLDAQCIAIKTGGGKPGEVAQILQLSELKKQLASAPASQGQGQGQGVPPGCNQGTNGAAAPKVPRRVSF